MFVMLTGVKTHNSQQNIRKDAIEELLQRERRDLAEEKYMLYIMGEIAFVNKNVFPNVYI